MSRAPRNSGVRQVRSAGDELNLVHGDAERVSGDLGERRPGTLAHIVRANFHSAASIAADNRAGFGLKHESRECRSSHAPADKQPILVAHFTRREWTRRPAEAHGSLLVA